MALTLMAGSQVSAQETAKPPAAEKASSPKAKKAKKPAKKLPVEAFAQLDFMDKATLSPDGRFIAALIVVDGGRRIAIFPTTSNSSQKMVALQTPDDMNIRWLRWVSNDYVLVGVSALVDFGSKTQQAYVSRLLSVRRSDGAIERPLWDKKGQDSADLLWVDPNGSGDVLIGAQGSIYTNDEDFWPSVYRVNIPTGKVSREKKGIPNVQSWGVDARGNIRYAIANKDRNGQQSLLYRGEEERNFRTTQRSNIVNFDSVELPFTFVPGTDNGLFVEEDEDGKSVVKEINLKSQEEVGIRHSLPELDIISPRLSFDRQTILGFRTSNKDNPYHWTNETLSAVQSYLEENVKGAQPQIVSYDRDLNWFLIWLSSPSNPGLYYIYNHEQQALQLLAKANEQIGTKRLAKPRYVSYEARDGLKIEGVLTLPKGVEAKNLPLILMPHGGPWAADYVRYDYWAQFLANRGYAVLQPNFRGSTGYGKAFLEKGYGQMGLAMQDDLTDGVLHLANKGIIDQSRVCIVGASYGGYAAMWGIIKDPDMYRCAISIAGVSNLRREVNDFGGSLLERTFKSQWGRMSEDFSAVSPARAADRVKSPLLLIHGKRDETVDYKQSVLMEDKMRDAGKDVEMLILDKADHFFERQDDRIALLSAMETFLMKHNPPD
ncbi:alpha/beta hydrolase family protein [Parasphingorhabdus sp. DH2-15]|uniref:alpha/beta hydrolase family protein n=1 Tax=Parasphingorhabdus sp. DH2-15 TaxID=3444112 RepID=UPI003F68574B